MSAQPAHLRLHELDNVIVALSEIEAGTFIEDEGVTLKETIPSGHKFAAKTIAKGDVVRKFGQYIGEATKDISVGEHVHVQNTACETVTLNHTFGADKAETDYFAECDVATFDGYVRADGQVGTRNYIGIMSTVNCSSTVVRQIAKAFQVPGAMDVYEHVDGVVGLTNGSGCAMNTNGAPAAVLRRTIAAYTRHPNFAGVVVVGLGCEDVNVPRLMEAEGLSESDALKTFVMQDMGGTAKTVAAGIEAVKVMLVRANEARREPVSAKHLSLALQCGGSDGYSGITANPALGVTADMIVRSGGTVCLSETSEVFGAEHLLTSRAVNDDIANKLLGQIAWWEEHVKVNGGEMNNNPSPGNKAGGLTTILEKSLGAIAKGGTTNLVDVIGFADPMTTKGFVFMDGPGYDPMSLTGQIAGGCNVACFTTGRGSCFGSTPAPCLKLASNSIMYAKMEDDMDVNTGEIADGQASVHEMGERIFREILDMASGKASKSEALGYGEAEFLHWHIGFYI